MINNYDQLVKKYKTPFFLYDIKTLRDRINYIKSKLDEKFKIVYAIKANTFIIKEIDDLVDGYEICSYGEYEICKNLELDNNKYVISGVNKNKDEIDNILNDGVKRFTIESLNQYNLLDDLTKKDKRNIEVLIRLTSGNQFGVSETDFKKIIELNISNSNIKIKGIEYFTGTQKGSIKKINKEVDYLVEFIEKIEKEYNFIIEEVEYGTGSPVYYFKEEFIEDEYFEELNKALKKIKNKKKSLEIGRSIVASCGKYFTSIVDKKTNKFGNMIILDGGINQLVYYGQTMAMRIPEFTIFPKRCGKTDIYNLYGSLCTINDIILKNINLNDPQINDYFIFEKVGAYSITEGIALFLSRELPKVIIKDISGNFTLVRSNIKTSKLNCPNYKEKEYEV